MSEEAKEFYVCTFCGETLKRCGIVVDDERNQYSYYCGNCDETFSYYEIQVLIED